MKIHQLIYFICFFGLSFQTPAQVPTDALHPGSKVYSYDFSEKKINCNRRQVLIYLPQPLNSHTAVVAFGHGQSLNESHYVQTYIHLAKKGIAVLHTDYSTGFFDTNWTRMARDYTSQLKCVLDQITELNKNSVVYSGHSKGAYVAGVAAGLAFKENLEPKPASVLLLNAAGLDLNALSYLDPRVEMTVVFSDKDSIVDQGITDELYSSSPALKKQFIMVKSYPRSSGQALNANHLWPLTKRSLLGGTTENSLHYHGSWKWLVAAAEDALDGAEGLHPYLYGSLAEDKGLDNLTDKVVRSF